MREPCFLRRAALAGALALSVTGLSATVERAQAMPAAPALAGTAEAGGMTTVQYMVRRPYRGYRHAGLYNCGPGALKTHLQRRACGSNGVGRNGRYR